MYTPGITFLNIKWPAPTKPTPQPDDNSKLIPTASHLPVSNHGDAFQTDSQLINHDDASIQFEYGEVSDLPVTSQNDVYSDRRNLAEKLEINENYIEAYKLYDELANQFDDTYALFKCAVLTMRGHGIAQDYKKAIKLFEKVANHDAAKFNHADANNNLGECYLHGLGVERNISKAFSCFLKAAQQSHAKAWYSLGWICEEREISYDNEEIPFYCYYHAAHLGVAHAWMKVGQMYLKGIPEFDISKAIKAFKAAGKMDIPEAYYELGGIYEDDSNYLKAFECYLLAVVFGVAEAWSSLERSSRKNLCDPLAISSFIKTANLSSLNLSGVKVSDEDIHFLITVFKINDAIQVINLSQTQISDQALQTLLDALQSSPKLPHLKELDLRGNQISHSRLRSIDTPTGAICSATLLKVYTDYS